jgi:nucleoside-diphosphate-sugar epimerase
MDLVTGATGLLGSHIVEKLRAAGRPVRVLVRPTSDTAFLDSLGVEKALGDVTDAAAVAKACQGVDTVYHAAAQVGDWGPWERFVAVTIDGTRNILQGCKTGAVKRLLHISSISTYGHPDGEGLVLDESAPLGVNLHKWSYYSRAKVEAEKLVRAAYAAGELAVTICKPSWLYGPRDRASLPRLIKAIRARKIKLIGDGNNRLNLTHAANEAEGCILAATNPKAVGETYNLSNDGVITQAQYFNKIAECLGCPPVSRKVPYKVAKTAALVLEVVGHATGSRKPPLVTRYAVWLMGRRCFFSAEKARRELNWQPTIGYDEGIRQSVQWCLEHETC